MMKNSKFNINTMAQKTPVLQGSSGEKNVQKQDSKKKKKEFKKHVYKTPNVEIIKKQQEKKKQNEKEVEEKEEQVELDEDFDIIYDEITKILDQKDITLLKIELEKLKEKYKSEEIQSLVIQLSKVQEIGVFVHTFDLDELDSVLQVLDQNKIPYSGFRVGNMKEKDYEKAIQLILNEHFEYGVILSLDRQIPKFSFVNIITSDTIQELLDQYLDFYHHFLATYPCVLKVVESSAKDTIINIKVKVDEGKIKIGTLLTTEDKIIGRILTIDRILNTNLVNIHVKSSEDLEISKDTILYSKLSRESIDNLKKYFSKQISYEDALLVQKLKKIFSIPDVKKE